MNLLAAIAAAGVLAGCAGAPVPAAASRDVPQLRLAPALLAQPMALEQQIDVVAAGRTQTLEVLLEAEPARVKLAMVAMGQVAATLAWDGRTLDETRAPWWPSQVSGSRVLSDLQLCWWPLPAIQAALPAGWTVSEAGDRRELRQGEELVTSVVRRDEGLYIELDQHRAPYRLTIRSVPLEPRRDLPLAPLPASGAAR